MSEVQNPLHESIFPLPRSKWIPDNKHKKCMRCKAKFSGGVFKSGKHHCRKCGHVVCKKCCKNRLRKQMVCADCYTKYGKYESIFSQTLIVPIGHQIDEDDQDHDDDDDDESDDDEDVDEEDEETEETEESLLIYTEQSPKYRRGSVTRKEPLIFEPDIHEDSMDSLIQNIHDRKLSINGNVNTVEDHNIDNTFKPNKIISYSEHYVPKNLEGDIMLQSSVSSIPSSNPLSNPPSLLQVHQIQIGDEGAHLTSAGPSPPTSPEPESPTPSDNTNKQKLLTQISIKCLNEQLSDHSDHESNHSQHSHHSNDDSIIEREDNEEDYIKANNKSRNETATTIHKKKKRKKKKRHSRKLFEKLKSQNEENIKFLNFNNININNHFINYGNYGNVDNNVLMLQNAIGILKLYIEQLSIYTQRINDMEDIQKLKQIKWTTDDVWNAVKQRQIDENRYIQELIEKDTQRQQNKDQQQNEYIHQNIDQICNNIMISDDQDKKHKNDENMDRNPMNTINAMPDPQKEDKKLKIKQTKQTKQTKPTKSTHIKPKRKSTMDAMEGRLSDEEKDGNTDCNKDIDDGDDGDDDDDLETLSEQKEIDIGFVEIYENIVAYEYDIKSLCDLILIGIENNDELNDEIHSYQIANHDFKNQLKHLQSEYDQVISDLNDKEYSLHSYQQREKQLMDLLDEHEMNHQQNIQQIENLQAKIQHNKTKNKNDINDVNDINIIQHKTNKNDTNNKHKNGDGIDVNNMSKQELSLMVEQLRNELKENEDKLKLDAMKQKEKYLQFVDKNKMKHNDTKKKPKTIEEDGKEEKDQEEETEDVDKERNKLRKNKNALDIEYDEAETKKILSILTYEKCKLFREQINGMKKWIKISKHDMRNLKTEFAENHQFLKLELNKFNEMKDDFHYQRGVLFQKKQKLHKYIQETVQQINEQEHLIKTKKLKLEQSNQRLMDREQELNQRASLLEKEKKKFDIQSRKYNQKQIDDELRNAQLFNDKMLEIEKKERKILSEIESLEIQKNYVNKQKDLYKKERELIHQQQQQVFFNEKQLQKQQDLLNGGQSYLQKEYIQAKDKYESDRFILLDKINKLETENSNFNINNQSLNKQLNEQNQIILNMEQDLEKNKNEIFSQKQENNKHKAIQFNQLQEINNLKQELLISNEKLLKYQQQNKLNDEKYIQQFQQLNGEKTQIQNQNEILKLEIDSLKDEIQLLKVNKKKKNKKKKSSPTKPLKPVKSLKSVKSVKSVNGMKNKSKSKLLSTSKSKSKSKIGSKKSKSKLIK